MVRTLGSDCVDHPFWTSASCTVLAVMWVYSSVVRRLDSDSLWGSMMACISASSLGYLSSVLGLTRAVMSLTQAMPPRNSLMPTSTARRFQPKTFSATRHLPSSSTTVTSPIAQRRAGQGINSTRRPIKSTISVDTPLRANVVVFMRNISVCAG